MQVILKRYKLNQILLKYLNNPPSKALYYKIWKENLSSRWDFFFRVLCTFNIIDHFHKWRAIINSFASIKISLTYVILKVIILKNFYSETRLVRLIEINKKIKLAAIYEKGLCCCFFIFNIL